MINDYARQVINQWLVQMKVNSYSELSYDRISALEALLAAHDDLDSPDTERTLDWLEVWHLDNVDEDD